ncbi:hypothetical protein FGB62_121g016 [Gracilaria domingensis]|nr:hypothetical protein FGB62_121g016 [Gracilaria domingensis]
MICWSSVGEKDGGGGDWLRGAFLAGWEIGETGVEGANSGSNTALRKRGGAQRRVARGHAARIYSAASLLPGIAYGASATRTGVPRDVAQLARVPQVALPARLRVVSRVACRAPHQLHVPTATAAAASAAQRHFRAPQRPVERVALVRRRPGARAASHASTDRQSSALTSTRTVAFSSPENA